MSSYNSNGVFRLHIDCDNPDASISIFDGSRCPISGIHQPPLNAELGFGLYEIQVEFTGLVASDLVHLDRNRNIFMKAPQITTAAPLDNRKNFDSDAVSQVSQLNRQLNKYLNVNSGIVIFRRTSQYCVSGKTMDYIILNLLDQDNKERLISTRTAGQQEAIIEAVPLNPGIYRLGAKSPPHRTLNVPVFPKFWTIACIFDGNQAYLRSASILTLPVGQAFNPADAMLKTADIALDMIRRGITKLPQSIKKSLETPSRDDPMFLLAAIELLSYAKQEHTYLIKKCVDRLYCLVNDCNLLIRVIDAMNDVSLGEPSLFLKGVYRLIDTSIIEGYRSSSVNTLSRIAPAIYGDSHWCTWNPDNALMEDESIDSTHAKSTLLPFEYELIGLLQAIPASGDMAKHLTNTLAVPVGSILMASRRLMDLIAHYPSLRQEALQPVFYSLQSIPQNSVVENFWIAVLGSSKDPAILLKSVIESLEKQSDSSSSSIMKAMLYLLNKPDLVTRWNLEGQFPRPGRSIKAREEIVTFFKKFLTSIEEPISKYDEYTASELLLSYA